MAKLELWQLSASIFGLLVLLHLLVSPFTKVEESFNMQATHDIMTYAVPTSNIVLRFKAQYDHMEFPGAVPRTFIGALVLAGSAKPFLWLFPEINQQRLVRSLLGFFNLTAIIIYTAGVRKAFGKNVAFWYSLLQASQFHLFYYASRTLPNMFAFGLSTLALRFLLPLSSEPSAVKVKYTRLAFYILTLATVIFRSELALLIASHALYMLAKASNNEARFRLLTRIIIPAGLSGAVVGLILTISIDTFFWQSTIPIWPELSAFVSNVFPAKDGLGASAWGTNPWHWYFTSAIPRLLVNPLILPILLIPLTTPALRSTALDLLIPNLAYITFYSILPHKETRFLFPILPPLTTLAALGTSHLSTLSHRSFLSRTALILLTTTTLLSSILSHGLLLPLSSLSYPGASALLQLHSTYHNSQPAIAMHLDNLALQTGVTRFLQLPPPAKPLVTLPASPDGRRPEIRSGSTLWRYDKTENATQLVDPSFWDRFDFAVMEEPGRAIGAWDVVGSEKGLGSVRLLRPGEGLNNPAARREAGTEEVIRRLYGNYAAAFYEGFRAVLRDGMGTERLLGRRVSLTNGWWVELPLVEKLFILKRRE